MRTLDALTRAWGEHTGRRMWDNLPHPNHCACAVCYATRPTPTHPSMSEIRAAARP